MSLLDRITARESCAVVGCARHKVTDSLFCREHLADMWANRLNRQADGTFAELPFHGRLRAKETTGWVA